MEVNKNKIYQIFKVGYRRVEGKIVNYYIVNVIANQEGGSISYLLDTDNLAAIERFLLDSDCVRSYISIPYTRLKKGDLNNSQICNEQQVLNHLVRMLGNKK